ncbi:MAG: alpha/beta fold hydrolase [Actinomycetota bacterium]
MPHTDAPGFRMYYEEHGSGFPLLLINGLGSDHLEWLHQLPAFEARFRGIVFDNRGTGMTDVPPGPYTTAGMADDAASLLRALGIARAHVLGVSLGGMIAQEVALRHPDLVEGLVLGCTGPGGEHSVRPSAEAMAAFALAKGEDPEAELRRMLPFLYTDACIRERPEEIEGFVRRRLDHPTPPEGYLAQLSAAVTHDAGPRLGKIRAKTLVITGDADRLVNWENSLRLAGRIPGATLVVLPGAPHRLFAEVPARLPGWPARAGRNESSGGRPAPGLERGRPNPRSP